MAPPGRLQPPLAPPDNLPSLPPPPPLPPLYLAMPRQAALWRSSQSPRCWPTPTPASARRRSRSPTSSARCGRLHCCCLALHSHQPPCCPLLPPLHVPLGPAAACPQVEVLLALRGTLNVANLEEVCEDGSHVHLVLEHCSGGELLARTKSARHYSERTAASFLRAVLRAVAVCHAKRIIHRDIKPENVGGAGWWCLGAAAWCGRGMYVWACGHAWQQGRGGRCLPPLALALHPAHHLPPPPPPPFAQLLLHSVPHGCAHLLTATRLPLPAHPAVPAAVGGGDVPHQGNRLWAGRLLRPAAAARDGAQPRGDALVGGQGLLLVQRLLVRVCLPGRR